MTEQTSPTPFLAGMSAIADNYDAFLIDAWGVLHDGVNALPGAADCMARLGEKNKTLVVISNASRRAAVVTKELAKAGVPSHLYDHIVTSGEHAWQAITAPADPWHASLGKTLYYLGPDRSRSILEGLGPETTDVSKADYILATGALSTADSVEDYDSLLLEARDAGVPYVCTNADRVAIWGGQRYVCAGAIGDRYLEMGGNVYFHGKPDKAVYETCFGLLPGIDKARIAAIGDSFQTDMAGAATAGIDGVFICGGIHGEELGIGTASGELPSRAAFNALCQDKSADPAAALALFSW